VSRNEIRQQKLRVGYRILKLKIIGAIGSGVDSFETIGATGAGFGGSKWS
jgi:hypothetical protein